MNYYNYFTEIEDAFIRRRGKHLLLSPIDWAMIEGWQERGIPLHIVLRGIESVFDVFDKNPRPRTIKGLLFCREEIEAQYQEWLASQVGKDTQGDEPQPDPGITTEAVRGHIDGIVAALRGSKTENIEEDVDRACTRLEELRIGLTDDLETVDKSLCDIENFIDQALLSKTDKEHLKNLEKETAAQLKAYKSEMAKDVYEHTFRLMLLKRLRDEAGIPRMSLFYL
jgi:hypothetical protein